MILLYANPIEVKYLRDLPIPKIHIGLGAEMLDRGLILPREKCLLFGMSGWNRMPDDYWGEPEEPRLHTLYLWNPHYINLIDMETGKVFDYCKRAKIPFCSIRYIIDYNRGKVMPTPFNHFWRIFQHRRMQRKLYELVKTDQIPDSFFLK